MKQFSTQIRPIRQIWVPNRVPIGIELIFFFTDTDTSYMNYAERAFATQQDGWFKLGGDFTPPSKRRQLFSIMLFTIFNGRINFEKYYITLSEIKRDFPMEFPFFDSKT